MTVQPERLPTASAGEDVLAVEGLSVRFGGVHALKAVTFSLRRNDIVGLIGPNGAGKTTLFDVISGLLDPLTGSIRYLGQDITSKSALWRARHGVRRTFQRQQIFGQLTVEDNVLVGQEWRRGGGGIVADVLALPSTRRLERHRREAAMETLELCGLISVRDKAASQLPIGLARMIELARALVDAPTLLLLDEPTSGLAAADVSRLTDVLHRVRASGCSIVLVEHDMSFVMQNSDRIVVLERGAVVAEETPASLQTSKVVQQIYLG